MVLNAAPIYKTFIYNVLELKISENKTILVKDNEKNEDWWKRNCCSCANIHSLKSKKERKVIYLMNFVPAFFLSQIVRKYLTIMDIQKYRTCVLQKLLHMLGYSKQDSMLMFYHALKDLMI